MYLLYMDDDREEMNALDGFNKGIRGYVCHKEKALGALVHQELCGRKEPHV